MPLLPLTSPVTATQRATKRIDVSLANVVRSITSALDSIANVLSSSQADNPPGGVLAKTDIVAAAAPRYDTLDAFVAALANAANIASDPPIYAAPAIVTDGNSSGITDQTATLNATVNPGGVYSTIYFKNGVDTYYGSTTFMKTISGNADAVNIALQLTGQSTTTTYHYQVIVVNPLGTIAGADQTFTTAATAPLSPPADQLKNTA